MKKASSFQNKTNPYLYLIPCLILIGLFVYLPLINTFSMSMCKTNAMGDPFRFVGTANYQKVLLSEEFINSLIVTGKFVVMAAVPTFVAGLAMALLTRKRTKVNSVFEALFSLPIVISSASGTMIFMLLLNPSTGFVNFVLGQKLNWFTDERYALGAIAILTVWLSVGFNYVFFLAGLRNVPKDIAEAAIIDGAGPMIRFFKITMPLISPTMFFVSVMNVAIFMQTFTQISILTHGGPAKSTNVLVYSIYSNVFINSRYDVASVVSILLFVIMLLVTLIQFRFEKKVVYDN